MGWDDQITVKKGKIGESAVKAYLINNGFVPYSPENNGAHPFDLLVASKDKKKIFVAESKAKPARTYYPDTGINISHYQDYQRIQNTYNMDVFIFFVDEDKGMIYGNFLSKLDQPIMIAHLGSIITYPLVQGGIRYFPLELMENIAQIPKDELDLLRQYSTRNPAYKIDL